MDDRAAVHALVGAAAAMVVAEPRLWIPTAFAPESTVEHPIVRLEIHFSKIDPAALPTTVERCQTQITDLKNTRSMMSDQPTVPQEGDRVRKVTLEARHVAPGETWHTKEAVAAMEQASLKFWNELDDEHRQAVTVLVRDALLRLIEDPDLWIPTSLEPKSNNRLDLYLNIHFAEIDEEVVRRRVETEREVYRTREDLVTLRDELVVEDDETSA